MRTLLISAMLVGAPLACFGDQSGYRTGVLNTRTYHVSKDAKDKKLLMRVFKAVKEAEAKKAAKTHGKRALTVKQRINSKTFLVSAGGNADYWFLALEPKDLNNRDRFRVDAVLTDQTKTFRNENGEDVKVRVLQEVKSDPLPTFTKEEFVKRLKAGETWTLVEFAEAKCQKCGGDGRVGELEHATDCDDCEFGEVLVDYHVKW